MDTHLAIGWALAASSALQRDDLATFHAEAAEAMKFLPGEWISMSRPDGQIVLNSLRPPGTALPKSPNVAAVRRALDTKSAQVVDLTTVPVTGKTITYVTVPAYRNGEALYSIAIAMTPERFLRLLQEKISPGEAIAIIDRQRRFIARIPGEAAVVGQPASTGWHKALRSSTERFIDNQSVEGIPVLTAYASTTAGWSVGIGLPEVQIAGPLQSVLWRVGAISAMLLCISIFLAFWLGRSLAEGMRGLAAAAEGIGEGKAIKPPPAPFSEAAEIGEAMARASAEIWRRGELLANENVRLEEAVALRTTQLVEEIEQKSRVEASFRQSEKMRALGQLTGGVAHDFNNMLTVVISAIQLLQRRLARGDTDVTSLADAAMGAAMKAAAVTRRLLAFSRQQPLSPEIGDVNALIEDIRSLLARAIGEQVGLSVDSADSIWPICVDVEQLENAVLNLVTNARDAMPDGGRLTITTSNVSGDRTAAKNSIQSCDHVSLSAADTGTGMDASVLSRALEPFYTTKPVRKGTGLGLSQVQGFVQQSGGEMLIDSTPGVGTSISLCFPRREGDARHIGGESAADIALAVPGKTILVVEDQQEVRETTVKALRELGYSVHSACDAVEAIRLQGLLPRLDLVLTDVVMPGMDGAGLVERMRSLQPGLRVVFMTGYSDRFAADEAHGFDEKWLLRKPFSIEGLAETLRAALD